MGQKNPKLTEREYEIMEVLWENKKEMTINEICEKTQDPTLTVPCVAQIMPRLLKKGSVHVEHMISAKTKYARTFLPNISKEQYLECELDALYQKTDIAGMLSMLVRLDRKHGDNKLLDELENYVKEQRQREKGEN